MTAETTSPRFPDRMRAKPIRINVSVSGFCGGGAGAGAATASFLTPKTDVRRECAENRNWQAAFAADPVMTKNYRRNRLLWIAVPWAVVFAAVAVLLLI